jgi:hypothetical protein
MALKTKKPRFKVIGSGEMNTGGAPIFADDLVTIQENARADFLNGLEYYRSKLPPLLYYQGIGNPTAANFKNGLILSGCEYNNTNPQNPVVSEGFIYSGGEICYFPGGTYNTGPTNAGLIYLFKGAETTVSRVFNDGGNKQIFTSFACTVETASVGAQGPQMPAGTAIVPTSEVVVICCGVNTQTIAESYFTKEAALGLVNLGAQINKPAWVSHLSLNTFVSFDGTIMPFLVSRILKGQYTEIRGGLKINSATIGGGSNVTLATLSSHSITTGASVGISASWNNQALEAPRVSVNLNGQIRLQEPSTGWSHLAGDPILIINAIVYGKNTAPSEDVYTFDASFLNIT